MTFTQQTFLGASIVSFRGSLGWGDNPSTLTVSLVEDPDNGDVFNVPGVGVPVLFRYSNWTFGGIIQNWKKDYSTGGHPVYEVILVDPREILGGVQLILSGYSDTTYGVPNLVNVYGYHENRSGFGGAEVNDAGIPWQKVRDAVVALTAFGTSSSYGGPISLGGYVYSINLSGLPSLPSYYRVPAQSMSLMEYIKFVCDAANFDFFFTCTPTGGGGFITLVTINRNIQPVSGAIDRFISSVGGSVTKNAGYELRNEITSKFLAGGPVSEMYIQANVAAAGGDDGDFETNPEQNSLWPYWGLDYEGNAIIGNGNGTHHQFNVPTKGLNVHGVGDYYPMDVAELMAAYEGQDSWEAFLCLHDKFRYVNEDFLVWAGRVTSYSIDYVTDPISGARLKNAAGDELPYYHNFRNNPHYGKASYLNICGGGIPPTLVEKIMGVSTLELEKFSANDMLGLDKRNLSTYSEVRIPGVGESTQDNIDMLYQFVSTYARSYYGQQFMIRMPFIESARDSESNNITISRMPVSAGFIDEDQWENAVSQNYLPGNVDRMLDNENKIRAYVRFNDITNLDFSNIEESNLILSDNGQSAFVLCDVQQQVVYQDKDTLYSPRAIVTLPGPIFPLQGPDMGFHRGVLRNFLLGELGKQERKGGRSTNIEERVVEILSKAGCTNLNYAIAPLFVVPDIIVVPLQSNIARYGPWYATGANGQLDLEIDETIVPWAFGGYDEMNQAAEAKVTSAVSRYQVHEAGSIQFPGVPTVHMGSALVDSGPYVTDINVSIGTDGATTTYNMGTWTPQPFRFRKAQSEYVQRVNKKQQELRQQFRTYLRATSSNLDIVSNRATAMIRGMQKTARKKKASPHLMISGTMSKVTVPAPTDTNEDATRIEYKHVVAIDTDYGVASSLGGDYERTGGGSLDTLFIPFSVNYEASGIPHFEEPTDTSGVPNGSSLNPFIQGTNFGAIVRGSGFPEEGLTFNQDSEFLDIRGLALRAPLVLAGWGYDIEGKPIPNSGIPSEDEGGEDEQSDSFHQDYLTRKDLWKCGPVDIRWDDNKKMWIAGTSMSRIIKLNIGRMYSDSIASGEINPFRPRVYDATVMNIFVSGEQLHPSGEVCFEDTGEHINVVSYLTQSLANNRYYMTNRINGLDVISMAIGTL